MIEKFGYLFRKAKSYTGLTILLLLSKDETRQSKKLIRKNTVDYINVKLENGK